MPLVSYADLLRNAQRQSYAVGAFNIFALEFLPVILEAAEEESSPVLLQINPVHYPWMDLPAYLGYVKAQLAKTSVPVGLNLDHGKSLDSIVNAIKAGFSGVMFDASHDPIEENIEKTNRIAELARSAGVSLEAARDFRFGFTVETPTYYSISEDFATFLETRFDDGFVGSYGFEFDEDVGFGTFDYEILTPWRLGGGVAYKLGDLTLLADAEFIDWSQLELRSDDFSFFQENQDISQNLQQVVNTRFGAEFGLGDFVVRGGFGFQPDPRDIRPDLLSDANAVDRDKTFWSAGVSYVRHGKFAIDFGWSQERFDDRFVPYSVSGAPVVEEEIVRNRGSVGVRVFL